MLLLVSIIVTRYWLLREHWRRHSLLAERGVLGSDRPIGRHVDLGGCLAVVDWTTKTVTDVRPLQGPTGFVQQRDRILVAQWHANQVSVLDRDLNTRGSFSNPLLNDAHTLSPLPDGLLIANTGLDAVLALNDVGALQWSWLATENGYPSVKQRRPQVGLPAVEQRPAGRGDSCHTAFWSTMRSSHLRRGPLSTHNVAEARKPPIPIRVLSASSRPRRLLN